MSTISVNDEPTIYDKDRVLAGCRTMHRGLTRLVQAAILSAIVACGCATVAPVNVPVDRVRPETGYRIAKLLVRDRGPTNNPDALVFLTFSGGEHVDWCVASGVLVSRRVPDFPVDVLVAIRSSHVCKVEVPLSASGFCMGKNRLEAFSDGVIAIIITIMVLEMKVPHGEGIETLVPLIPVFLSYVLSFVYLGIYWNNHHHMLHATQKVTGRMLWANLHLLFWLSLIPFATGWMGENDFAAAPSALYGVVLLMAAVAYLILQQLIIASQGPDSILKKAIAGDWKGKLSSVLYAAAIPLAFWRQWISLGLYVFAALLWLIPDRRIEKALHADGT